MQNGNNIEFPLEKVARISLYIFIGGVSIFVLYLVKGALFPFVIGIVLTYVLYPLVISLERLFPFTNRYPNFSKGVAIAIIYVALIVVTVIALLLIVPPLFRQSTDLLGKLPAFITDARSTVEGWNQEYASNIPEEIRLEIDKMLGNAGQILVGAFRGIINRTALAAVHALTLVVGLVVVPIFVFYLLKDREKIRESFIESFPVNMQIHVVHILRILNRVIGAYVRAQVSLAAGVWVVISIGLFLMGVEYAVLLGAVAGIFELVPIIGAWLGALPAVVVVLSTSPEKVVWVIILYAGVQTLQGAVLVPRIQSFAMKVHPLVILVAIVIGSELGGLWGVILGPPILASGKEIIVYLSNPEGYENPNEIAEIIDSRTD